MTNKNDGGPAFAAFAISETNGHCIQEGMTPRDYMAAAALTGLLSMYGDSDEKLRKQKCLIAYEYADAMLAAREGEE